MVIVSHSEAETRHLGLQLARVLPPGITVALDGPLGSGKTNLVRAVCIALGVAENQVNSPTFVLMQSYPDGRIPVFHFDTYRLSDLDEFLAIGAEEFLNDKQAICFVEWAERVSEALPADRLSIRMEQISADARRLILTSGGPVSESVCRAICAATK